MNKAMYSIQDKRDNCLIYAVWDTDNHLLLSWTLESNEAARWCADCKQTAYDSLPDDLRSHCKVVVNVPFHDGWGHLCRDCTPKEVVL